MLDALFQKSNDLLTGIDSALASAKKIIGDLQSVGDGDRVWFTFVSSFDFAMHDVKVQDLMFTIPNDADFIAKRLFLNVGFNRHNAIAVDPEGLFHSLQPPYELSSVSEAIVDFQVELFESYYKNGDLIHRAYQDLPIPAILTYSRNNPTFGSPSAMCFDLDWEIRRCSVLQCKVSVLTANQGNDAAAGDSDTYRITGMLEGYKKVRAFK